MPTPMTFITHLILLAILLSIKNSFRNKVVNKSPFPSKTAATSLMMMDIHKFHELWKNSKYYDKGSIHMEEVKFKVGLEV